MYDGGWVTKIPNGGEGEGFVFVHLKEADWELTRRAFRTLGISLKNMGDDPGNPTNVTKAGFLAKVLFDNRSRKPFVRDWTGRDRAFDIFLSMCYDIEDFWMPRFEPEALLVKKVDEGIKELMWPKVEVEPGAMTEKLFLFRPNKEVKFDGRLHGFHVATAFITASHFFGYDLLEVPFPFFNPHRELPNAVVDLRFAADPGTKEEGPFVLPPMTVVRTREGSWMTEGYVSFESPTSDDQFCAFVPTIRTTPGPPGEVPPGSLSNYRITQPGYKLPENLNASNPARPEGGDKPRQIENWVQYSYKEEKAAEAAWEATPLKDKIAKAEELMASSDPDDRAEGVAIVGKYANEAYLDLIIPVFEDENPTVAMWARRAYRDIVGMTYEQHMALLAAKEAERERIAAIARKEGRVTHITIKDSVLQRTSIDLGDSGETHVQIKDSVVTRSDIEGKDKADIKDSVVVGQKDVKGKVDTDVKVGGGGPKEGETEEHYEERLAKYEKALKKALADGVITDKEKRLLEMLRKKFGISEDEHEMVLEMLK
jgi:hypothetical protein